MKEKIKYPRTPHVTWSPGRGSDDKVLLDLDHMSSMRLVVTEKMDGENTTMTRNSFYARSLDSSDHKSQHYIKGVHGGIRHLIPPNIRIHGENLFAKHSIHYTDLEDYFLVFGATDIQENRFLSFSETQDICEDIGLRMVKVLLYDCRVKDLKSIDMDTDKQEGWVVRNISEFPVGEFRWNVAKFVRENHVQTEQHWKNKKIERNLLKYDN